MAHNWITVNHKKGVKQNFAVTPLYAALTKAYSTQPEFAAPPADAIDRPTRPTSTEGNAMVNHGSKHRRKIERRRNAKIAAHLKKVSTDKSFDDAISMAEDEATVMAKSHNTLAIDGCKPAPTFIQQGRIAGGRFACAMRQAARALTGITKRVWFKRETTTATFNKED